MLGNDQERRTVWVQEEFLAKTTTILALGLFRFGRLEALLGFHPRRVHDGGYWEIANRGRDGLCVWTELNLGGMFVVLQCLVNLGCQFGSPLGSGLIVAMCGADSSTLALLESSTETWDSRTESSGYPHCYPMNATCWKAEQEGDA